MNPKDIDFEDLTAHSVVADMGAGWNLGNTFDSYRGGSYDEPIENYDDMTISEMETLWLGGSDYVTTQTLIENVKAAGFNTLRIPVTWHKAIQGEHTSSDFTIREDWFERVKQVVDWATEQELYVILNLHHDDYILPFDTAEKTEVSAVTLTRLWTLIGNEFKDYDYRLIFEVLNEPRFRDSEVEWISGGRRGDETAVFYRQNVNILNQTAVDAIRATGGNNRSRILMIPAYGASAFNEDWGDAFDGFVKPTDVPENGEVNKFILSAHSYVPIDYTGITDVNGNWSRNDITRMMNPLQTQATRLGMPVVIGEWGAVARHESPEDESEIDRAEFVKTYVEEATLRGFATIWWDTGFLGEVMTVEGRFGLFNRKTGELHYSNITNAILAGID